MRINFCPKISYNKTFPINSPVSFGLRNPFTGTVPADDVFIQSENTKENGFEFLSRLSDKISKARETRKLRPGARDFFKRADKFQISDFLRLSDEEKREIKTKSACEAIFPASISAKFAIGLKDELDREFGKDGYVFCSVGSSPSLIAKAFECMGVETRYLPISGLTSRDADELILEHSFNQYGKFLERQGVTEENLKARDKKYIFFDFTKTRDSLNNYERLMTNRFHLPKDKIEFRSLNDELLYLFEDKIIIDDRDAVVVYINNFLDKSGAERYSSIKKLPVDTVDDADYSARALTKHNEDLPKFYNFYVMNSLDNMGLLKYNPDNNCAL